MQTQAQAIDGHGRDLNDALGNLGPFAEDTATLVDILNRQEGAVRGLIANTGVVFAALTERDGQLRSLIENSNTRVRDDRGARRAAQGGVHRAADVRGESR
jgi:ABC-type transporter Mla subunit MlaD